jgi:hypothetical protein
MIKDGIDEIKSCLARLVGLLRDEHLKSSIEHCICRDEATLTW